MTVDYADAIFINGKISTLSARLPEVTALAIKNGKILALGEEADIQRLRGERTISINLNKRRVIPGLNDSHTHLIRGGLNYNMELRWEGVTSLADALLMLKAQAERTPNPQWVRVVGGWSEFQFKERRMPTLQEINGVSPTTPVFILHLYDRALLNAAALRAVGITKDTQDIPGGRIERDTHGNPTGALIAEPNALILYSMLSKGPKLSFNDQLNSTRYFMRELNRLGITSVIDAGGGFQNYPEDYAVIEYLHTHDQLSVRIAYNLFTQNKGHELNDFMSWSKIKKPYAGDNFYRHNGAGEMLVFSAADFEDFLQPRPDLSMEMEKDLFAVVRFLAENKWPFRLHATYDETIDRALDVFEKINHDIPLEGLRWFFDHAETVSHRSLDRIKKLGGGIAIQHRMAFQGEYFVDRYGKEKASHSPPLRQMIERGIPVGAGTDATRVASYNPFICLYWLTTGKTVGGLPLYNEDNILTREEALRLWTQGSAYKSKEEDVKGILDVGQYADFAVLNKDYMTILDEEVKDLFSVMTVVGGKIVYGDDEFLPHNPSLPPVSPSWSPTGYSFAGFKGSEAARGPVTHSPVSHSSGKCSHGTLQALNGHSDKLSQWLGLGQNPQKRCFQNPWTLGCGCFVY